MTDNTNTIACNVGDPKPPREWTRGSTGWPCGYSKVNYSDLDMRRKAEILQYNSNFNKLTKKEKWAKIAKGQWTANKAYASQNQEVTNPNTKNLPQSGNLLLCSSNVSNCSSTTASDVPGTPQTLCFNANVPLYNYKTQRVWNAGANKWPFIGPRPGGPRLNYT